jgi:hypothetical protein
VAPSAAGSSFDKVFGHGDWYYPTDSFRVVSFDGGYRGHDVVIGVWTNVCDDPQTFRFASCNTCSMFPVPQDFVQCPLFR